MPGQPATMRSLFLLLGFGALLTAQQLRVKSANATSVRLEWSGAAGPVTVVRQSGTTSQNLANTDQPNYEDKSIGRFGTYRYHITAGGKSSNEVTVGPPPGGVTNAAPVPANVDPGKYGQAAAVALDENGDPVIAFEWADPNGDGDYSDNEVRFVRWSRAEYKWLPTVRVAVVGEIANQNLNPISVACDSGTGALAVVTPVKENGASLFLSKDGGGTWTGTPLAGIAGQVYATAMAISGGKIHLVVNSGDSGAHYITGTFSDPSSWNDQPLPSDGGWKVRSNVNVALALDPSGNPAMGWIAKQDEGDNHHFMFWRPGGKPTVVLETPNIGDSPSLALSAGGGKLGILVAAPLDEKDSDHGVWYTQSPDGASWSKASRLPVDGPRSTNQPVDVATDSRGSVAAVFGSNSGSAGTACNFPALSRSGDGVAWKTCGPGKAEGGEFSPQPLTLHIVESANDKAYLVWQEGGDTRYRAGILVWHER